MRERISRRSQGFESLHNQNGKQRRSPFAPRPFPENTDAPDSAEPAYQQNFAANSSSSMSDIPLFPPGKEDKNGETQLEPHIRAKVLGGESMENPPQVKQPNQTSDHNISKLKQEKSAGMIAPLGAITFGPIAIKIIGFTLLIFWLNNGGWEQIGEVTNFISQGITKTIDDIRNIISNVSQTAIERVNEIETYLAEYVFFAKGIRTNHSEDREFKKAIKKIEHLILTQSYTRTNDHPFS